MQGPPLRHPHGPLGWEPLSLEPATCTHWASVQQPSSSRSTPRKLTEQQSRTWRHPRGGAGGPEAGWLSLEPLCLQITAVSLCNRIFVFRWVLFAACSPVNQAGYCSVGSSQDLACHPPSSPRADITSHLGNELPLFHAPTPEGPTSLLLPSLSSLSKASSSSARTSPGK